MKTFILTLSLLLFSTSFYAQLADVVLQTNTAGIFGYSVSSAGDVNGDGYDDVIIGDPNYTHGQFHEGGAFIYLGSAAGLLTTPARIVESNNANSFLGSSVSSAGDVNGDGYDDVLVGAHRYLEGGGAFLYLGSATGIPSVASSVFLESNEDADFGSSVSAAGDVNGDGYDDIIIGAPYYDNGQLEEGRAYIYYGSAAGTDITADVIMETNSAFTYLGTTVTGAGDVNGDGYDDVAITAMGLNYKTYLHYGSAAGLSSTASFIIDNDDQEIGKYASDAGDVNGDGYDDIILGCFSADNFFVYHGSATGITSSNPSATINSSRPQALSSAGDINGDGYDDVISGDFSFSDGQSYEGAVSCYSGSAAGVYGIASQTIAGELLNANLGSSVSGAGDVNGDGYEDFLMGAPDYEYGTGYTGIALLNYGSGPCTDTFYADADGDGYGNAATSHTGCAPLAGYVADNNDCNDTNSLINPGETEACNGIDDNCDGMADEELATLVITGFGLTTQCQGEDVNMHVNPTTLDIPLQWQKNGTDIPGATSSYFHAVQSGNYTCTAVTACGTVTSNELHVVINKNPKAVIAAGGPTTFCPGGNVTLSVTPVAACTYQWYKGPVLITGATGTSYVATATGPYKCKVTKTATGCNKMSNGIYVTASCKEGDLQAEGSNTILVYPNPAQNEIHINYTSMASTDAVIRIMDISGALVYEQLISVVNGINDIQLSTEMLESGMYFIELRNGVSVTSAKFAKM